METILRKVMCSEGLPDKNGWYFCGGIDANGKEEPFGLFKFTLSDKSGNPYFSTSTLPTWWLEEVPINTIKADAWDEGYQKGADYQVDWEMFISKTAQIRRKENSPRVPTNPYK